jgi:dihydrolipoamide dehydrogenase
VPTWTSDEALSAQDRPRSLVVMGGGAVGCELSQVHVRFGVRTTLVESGPQLAGKEEPSIAALLAQVLRDDGVDVRLGVEVERAELTADGLAAVHLSDGTTVEAERVLVAVGRTPTTEGLGLECSASRPTTRAPSPWTSTAGCAGSSTSGLPGTSPVPRRTPTPRATRRGS